MTDMMQSDAHCTSMRAEATPAVWIILQNRFGRRAVLHAGSRIIPNMPFQILSLSGGGFLGLYTITLLAKMESRSGRAIASHFDLIAGTSIGGILALAIAAEIPAEHVKRAFEANGSKIFSNKPAPTTTLGGLCDFLRSLFSSKYGSEPLRRAVTEILGDQLLLGHLKHPVIIPTVNLTKGMPQVFKTDHHPNFRLDHLRRAIDVAFATSAAPTYFPIASVEDELFIDGGLFANSPDLLALHEAEHFFQRRSEDIVMLSIGTTTSKFSFSHNGRLNLGIFGWRRRLPQVLLSAQQQNVKFMLQHKLGNRYIRIDAEQSREQERDLALDVATVEAQKTIRGLAAATDQEFVNNEQLRRILSIEAPRPTFYHRA